MMQRWWKQWRTLRGLMLAWVLLGSTPAVTALAGPLGPSVDKPSAHAPKEVTARVVVVEPDFDTSAQVASGRDDQARSTSSDTEGPGGDTEEGVETPTCPPATPAPSRVMRVPDIVWVTLPGGVFQMGSSDGRRNERPVHRVIVGAFEISKTEVTVAQYRLCVEAGACTEPETRWKGCNWGQDGRDDHPVNCVDWTQAAQFARWVGGRLPTEAEWEFAARSRGQDRTYPWGDAPPTCARAVIPAPNGNGCGKESTWPVCSTPEGNTEQGLCDMAGNVWEWVADWYQEDYYADSPQDNPQGPAWGHYRVARGGAWFSPTEYLRTTARYGDRPGGKRIDMGFRVVREVIWNQ